MSFGEVFEQSFLLLIAKTLDFTIIGDANFFHNLSGFDFAQPRKAFQHREDSEFADIRVSRNDSVSHAQRALLELDFDDGPSGTSLSSLDEGRCTLFGCEYRRSSHN
jgi:hypothetical protein